MKIHGSLAFLLVALAACDNPNAAPETSAAKSAAPMAPPKVETKPSAKPAAVNPPPVDSGASVANVDTTKEMDFTKMPAQTDAEIAAIVTTMNQGEIDASDVAMKNAADDAVKKFAHHMHEDHTTWLKDAKDLAAKLKVDPKEGAISKHLKDDSESLVKMISNVSGKAFDKQYIDAMVTQHQSALDLIDQRLLMDVKAADLKKAIEGVKPKIQAHLAEAKALQATLSNATPGAASAKPATSAAPMPMQPHK